MKKTKIVLVIMLIIIFIISVGILIYKSISTHNPIEIKEKAESIEEPIKEKVDIIDINSTTRPYAVVVNNTPVAIKVQEGLNKAYLVYEIPTEGNTSRLLAFYKDIEEDLVVGTVRSARHNFIDFALESDAILCCFGWSIYAKNDLEAGSIDYFQGLFGRSIL